MISFYSAVGEVFMRAVLVPSEKLAPPDLKDLMGWQPTLSSSWGLCYSFNPPGVSVEPPLSGSCSRTLVEAGEQLVFAREFEGFAVKKHYIEVLQKLSHLFGLHYVEERSAYCRLDRHGDLEDVVSILRMEDPSRQVRGGTIVTIKRAVLDEYMAVTDTSVVRMFDIARFKPHNFGGWLSPVSSDETSDGDLHYRYHVEAGHASYMRGVQLIVSSMSKNEAATRLGVGPEPNRDYATFVVQDWRNGVVTEVSCEPGHTANYFTKSDLPFELSPVFFRSEVLLKYKADSEKYALEDRLISFRGAWHLETYDINEAGQVHTYLVYLRNLPYEEQLYWKAYNEPPKGPIAERACRTDFKGEWHSEYDAIQSVREIINRLNESNAPWWAHRSERLVERIHYPVTNSVDEWCNEILNLDQLVVEGLKSSWLRRRAEELGS